MVVAEEVQPRVHRGKDFVDLDLARIRAAAAGEGTERLGRLVGQEHVDVAKLSAAVYVLADEVAALVVPRPCMRQRRRRRVVPGRREGAAETGDAQLRVTARRLRLRRWRERDLDQRGVLDVTQIGRQIARRDGVEVVVVAVNPVDGSAKRLITAVVGGDVANAQPEGNAGMPRDDVARRGEVAVDVAERAEDGRSAGGCDPPYFVCAGTSRSVLSQMKSLLL
jgi:hypothetical protein